MPNYTNLTANNTAPAEACAAVTPNDGTDLVSPPGCGNARALYVGTGGNVTINDAQGNTVTFANVSSGATLAVRAKRVLATGTTASNLVALY